MDRSSGSPALHRPGAGDGLGRASRRAADQRRHARGLSAAITRKDWTAALAEIETLEGLYDRNPDDYCAAQVVAQGHVDFANARRKSAPQGQLSREIWSEGAVHFERAETLVTLFDPIEEMSPLLAGTRYGLVPGIEDGGAVSREWYEDWVDLDPEDATVHAAHAVNMLPGWYGSLSGFERAARRSVRMTEAVTGKASYAVFHISAAEALGDLSPTIGAMAPWCAGPDLYRPPAA
jgi:hypothetical protein